MPLRCLFVDMNSFFASVEQQDDATLRGRPVAVIPVQAEGTCCIAASYEAKAYGIRTGTAVWEARKLCPRIVFRVARHDRYVVMHHRIVDAIGSCVPIEQVRSVDEVVCRLIGDERRAERATDIGKRIKAAVLARAGDHMRCSVGVGPNELLAKMAADLHKPDGLTVIADADLPDCLHGLPLTEFPGIARRMERRLKLHGIFSTEQLCAAPAKTLAAVWGSKLLGERWHRLLRGEDVPAAPTRRQTVSHSHVLPPDLRTDAGAYGVLVKLTHKAAARMRKINYWAGAVSLGVSYLDGGPAEKPGWGGYGRGGWEAGCRMPRCQDTLNILRALGSLWARRPASGVPFKVGMVLSDLVPTACATPSLFEDDRNATALSHAMDDVNREFGASVVYFGSMYGMKDAAPTRVAFNRIPDFDRVVV